MPQNKPGLQGPRRPGEAAEEFELALTETRGLWAFRCDLHMNVMIHSEYESQALFSGMRKQKGFSRTGANTLGHPRLLAWVGEDYLAFPKLLPEGAGSRRRPSLFAAVDLW